MEIGEIGVVMIYQTLSKKQVAALSWWNRPGLKDFDGIICDGSVRSGKTLCMTDGFFLWSMSRFQNGVFGICGRTIGALRRNIIVHLGDWMGGIFSFQENRMENKLTVTDPSGRKNTYYLFGGQDESSYKVIQGITLAGVLLDEAALMPKSFVEQACARCSEAGSKLWFNCNPEGPEHWFYKEWILQAQQKKLLHLHMTMADNPALTAPVRQRYERLYKGVFYRRYVLGQWCRAEGLVYSFDRELVVRQLPEAGAYYISIDYGVQNPFSAGLWCVNGGRAVRIAEFYYDGRAAGRSMTDAEYYQAIKDLAGGRPIRRIVIDPSAASFIALIRAKGEFSVRKARNGVMEGIRVVDSMLQAGVVAIGAGCENAIREFSLYSWEESGDRPKKEHDHAMDEIRYFCNTIMRRLTCDR